MTPERELEIARAAREAETRRADEAEAQLATLRAEAVKVSANLKKIWNTCCGDDSPFEPMTEKTAFVFEALIQYAHWLDGATGVVSEHPIDAGLRNLLTIARASGLDALDVSVRANGLVSIVGLKGAAVLGYEWAKLEPDTNPADAPLPSVALERGSL